jgi:hypothetical protein
MCIFFFTFYFLAALGLTLRALGLLGRCSTTWITPLHFLLHKWYPNTKVDRWGWAQWHISMIPATTEAKTRTEDNQSKRWVRSIPISKSGGLWQAIGGKITQSESSPTQTLWKIIKAKIQKEEGVRGVAHVVEHLPSKHDARRLNPGTAPKK